jgi:hypothetical protein
VLESNLVKIGSLVAEILRRDQQRMCVAACDSRVLSAFKYLLVPDQRPIDILSERVLKSFLPYALANCQ